MEIRGGATFSVICLLIKSAALEGSRQTTRGNTHLQWFGYPLHEVTRISSGLATHYTCVIRSNNLYRTVTLFLSLQPCAWECPNRLLQLVIIMLRLSSPLFLMLPVTTHIVDDITRFKKQQFQSRCMREVLCKNEADLLCCFMQASKAYVVPRYSSKYFLLLMLTCLSDQHENH